MSTFPGELVDLTIDFAHSHQRTLAACGLVCRAWLPRSRLYLFSSVYLIRDRRKDTVSRFMQLIESPLVTFLPYIEEVKLHHRSSYGAPVFSATDILTALSDSGLSPVRLSVDCRFDSLKFPQTFAVSLTHLRLDLYNEVPLEDLVDYVCSFPLLESLSLGLQSETYISSSQPRTTTLPRNLHTLDVSDPGILEWLLSVDPQISTLTLREVEVWPLVNAYLVDRAAGALRSLTLDSCYIDNSALGRPDLSHLDGLRHLDLEQERYQMAGSLSWVISSICEAPACRTLETIQLGMYNAKRYTNCAQMKTAAESSWSSLRSSILRDRTTSELRDSMPFALRAGS
ncbi:hypothetical protein B0H10DRAFT_2021768 [Mycena sp. CBHHK59/15]|nr:hypothetical protein B0H10DRAFT_2021768 [Mycena sp. CBHHK59/15]